MSRQLPLPSDLTQLPYFVVRWNREDDSYDLLIPSFQSSYRLGDAFKTRVYLERAAGEYVGGRAMDAARSFGASQAMPAEQRVFAVDLTKDILGKALGYVQAEKRRDHERLFGNFDEEKALVV